METTVLKERIHRLVDSSDEEMLQAVYQLLRETDYTDDFKNIIHEEYADYQKTKKVISKEDMDRLVKEALKG